MMTPLTKKYIYEMNSETGVMLTQLSNIPASAASAAYGVYISTSECAMPLDGAETLFEIFEELCEFYDGIRNKNGRQLVNVPIAQHYREVHNQRYNMERGFSCINTRVI
jgi:hypothetical protein